jgi:hypothetical protein
VEVEQVLLQVQEQQHFNGMRRMMGGGEVVEMANGWAGALGYWLPQHTGV